MPPTSSRVDHVGAADDVMSLVDVLGLVAGDAHRHGSRDPARSRLRVAMRRQSWSITEGINTGLPLLLRTTLPCRSNFGLENPAAMHAVAQASSSHPSGDRQRGRHAVSGASGDRDDAAALRGAAA